MLADIFITTKDRASLFESSLESLLECTDRSLFRLTVVHDSSDEATKHVLSRYSCEIDHVLSHRDNLGLGPSINQALAHIDALNRYNSDPQAPDPNTVSEFVVYCQDDLLYSDGWLEKLTQFFLMFEGQKKLGFASGVECIEHEVREELGTFAGTKVITKDWIRAAQMFARRQYWMSMFPIPRYDPETRNIRAKPNDGMGSGVDWWFIRNHENSVCRSGKTNLVLPGLVQHAGYRESTWLDRELPESEDDKKVIQKNALRELTRLSQEMGGYDEIKNVQESTNVITQGFKTGDKSCNLLVAGGARCGTTLMHLLTAFGFKSTHFVYPEHHGKTEHIGVDTEKDWVVYKSIKSSERVRWYIENMGLKIIFMVRDPRDAVTSRNHNHGWDKYVQNAYDLKCILSNVMELEPKHLENVAVVKFEELATDPDRVQKEIADKLGLEIETPFSECHKKFGSIDSDDYRRYTKNLMSSRDCKGARPIDANGVGRWEDPEHDGWMKKCLKHGVHRDCIQSMLEHFGYDDASREWMKRYF